MIDSFRGKHGFLSNMYVFKGFVYDGALYQSTESFFQAMKTKDKSLRLVMSKLNGGKVKVVGRLLTLREDWTDQLKEEVMLYDLRKKFSVPYLRKLLQSTGDEELAEGNYHGDTYWGVCKGTGKNRLGILLMQVRSEISSTKSGKNHGQSN